MVTGEVLRLMEESAQDNPDQLDQGFTAFSECSSVGLNYQSFSILCNPDFFIGKEE